MKLDQKTKRVIRVFQRERESENAEIEEEGCFKRIIRVFCLRILEGEEEDESSEQGLLGFFVRGL